MEHLLVTTEVIVVTVLTFILALAIEPLLVMAVLGLAKRAAQLPTPAPRPARAQTRRTASAGYRP